MSTSGSRPFFNNKKNPGKIRVPGLFRIPQSGSGTRQMLRIWNTFSSLSHILVVFLREYS